MRGERISDEIEYAIWIVWKLHESQPVLVAIDTSQERAERHESYVRQEAALLGKPVPETFVEQSRTNGVAHFSSRA